MTLDAVLANMEELCRLKELILKDPDPNRQSTMRSTRSAASLPSSSSSSTLPSAVSVSEPVVPCSETDRLDAHSLKYLPLPTASLKGERKTTKRAHPDANHGGSTEDNRSGAKKVR